MEFDKVLQKRVRGMAVRILACIEHTLSCHLDDVADSDTFQISGSELKVLRSEILNSAGDTTRSLVSLGKNPVISSRISAPSDVLASVNDASLGFVSSDEDGEDVPVFQASGNFDTLNKIRELVNCGIVYNNKYVCVGIDNVVDRLLPFLDKLQLVGVKIADGDYNSWRNDVCDLYLEGLENE